MGCQDRAAESCHQLSHVWSGFMIKMTQQPSDQLKCVSFLGDAGVVRVVLCHLPCHAMPCCALLCPQVQAPGS